MTEAGRCAPLPNGLGTGIAGAGDAVVTDQRQQHRKASVDGEAEELFHPAAGGLLQLFSRLPDGSGVVGGIGDSGTVQAFQVVGLFPAGKRGKVRGAPAALPGGEERTAGKRTYGVDAAPAVGFEEGTWTDLAPVHLQILPEIPNRTDPVGQIPGVTPDAIQLAGGETVSHGNRFCKGGIDGKGATATATSSAGNGATRSQVLPPPLPGDEIEKALLASSLGNQGIPPVGDVGR